MNLSDIRDSFLTRTFDLEQSFFWLMCIGILSVLLVTLIIIRHIRVRKLRYHPHGSVTDPAVIRSIFQLAFDQRRPFELQVHSEADSRRPNLRSSPEYMGAKNFTLELTGVETLSDSWLGRELNAYFRIYVDKEFVYYTFTSTIEGIHNPYQGVCHITLPLPERLENRQKRAFLRIVPPPEFFKGSAIWHDHSMPDDSHRTDISFWPVPSLICLPGRTEQFRILNLSAGGARIKVPQTLVKQRDLHFHSVEQIITMVDLVEPEANKILRLWLRCRIQSVWFEHPSRDLYVGLQFLAWARPKEHESPNQPAGSIEWFRLPSSNEVDPVGNWIMRRHLEMFREIPNETN